MPFDLQVKLPFAIIMLAAGLWTMAVVHWYPQWLNQTTRQRLKTVVGEGLVCGLIWGAIVVIQYDLNIESAALNGALAGVLWLGVGYTSRRSYQHILVNT